MTPARCARASGPRSARPPSRAASASLCGRIRRLAAASLATLLVSTAASAVPAPVPEPGPVAHMQQRIDGLVRRGYEHPAEALVDLQALLGEQSAPDMQARVLVATGLVQARSGLRAEADATIAALQGLGKVAPGVLVGAGAGMIRAEASFIAGQTDRAAEHAQQALAQLLTACPTGLLATPAPPSLPPPGAVPECEWRLVWGALRLLERHWQMAGVEASATAQATASLRLSEWAGDTVRQSTILAMLAQLAERRGDHVLADRLLQQARNVAYQPPLASEQARVESAQASLLAARGDLRGALQFRETAVALAAQADAPRLQAQMLTNLADTELRLHRPAEALAAAEKGLVIVRGRRDEQAERALVHNAGLAKIALGRIAEGRQDLLRVLEHWRANGELGRQAEALREFGEALAAAGEAREALALYHQERAISDELMTKDRAAALKVLQTRNDAEARQRDIALLARENALQSEALHNRDLLQVVWGLLAAVFLLGCGVAYLFYRRLRRTHGELSASHAELQLQSERDPLTNLANRRRFAAVMVGHTAAPGGFVGALLLVDIDHFKRVNDTHGHAGGDRALVEVGERLVAAVRAGDLVVRWGGEEFLILAPQATAEQAEQIAARILVGVGATPVVAGGRALRLTVSVGHASYPGAAGAASVDVERAVQLADRALLAAKDGGRNRAVGITAMADGADLDALLSSQTAFVAACETGQVALRRTAGPPAPSWRQAA